MRDSGGGVHFKMQENEFGCGVTKGGQSTCPPRFLTANETESGKNRTALSAADDGHLGLFLLFQLFGT